MNIFFLDSDPKKCARYHCDKHVVKMVTEYAQLLSSALWVYEPKLALKLHKKGRIYNAPPSVTGKSKHAHFNHPCMIWTRHSRANFDWLRDLTEALAHEYWVRYGKAKNKQHSAWVDCAQYLHSTDNFPDLPFSKPSLSMPDQYKGKSAILSYRRLYIHEKIRFATYTNRKPPKWLAPFLQTYKERK